MFDRMLKRFRHAMAKAVHRLRLTVQQKLFKWQWCGIDLTFPSTLHPHVEGRVLVWQEDWIRQLERALGRLPQAVIKAAKVSYIFVAKDLRRVGLPHDGVAYEFTDKSDRRKWIGLDISLFTPHFPESEPFHEPDLGVPLMHAILAEEIAHVWDYRLEDKGSPYSSAGAEWRRVEFDPRGRIKPFNIPNRRPCRDPDEQSAEDWASA